ncbi:NADP-dependent oxidoreductase [Actinomadura bangladeshensis]|uniref:NADP-dependent oxidoreductase n=1 Tax=Actinomadura bangladeshensis TaxID=453573 RepID=A0A4V2XN06_9ACTN|nr:NADP-dependent oxidoreductase [Actinomadura bangladeshensis]TDC16326.1 NADP-dependent oxidoreductase [Actinomadura bangladeshensis]
MRAVRVHERGGTEGLVLEDAPDPRPATGDVVVRVHAAGFVPDELDWPGTWVDRAGRDRTPSIPAHDVAGVVAEVAYGTAGFAVGDRVFGLTDWHRDGAAAEYVAVEARNLAHLPGSVGFTEAAALPLAGLTCWQALFVHGGLEPGRTVVVHGGGGGVGSLAVRLARDAGAHVIATGRARAAEVAMAMGAHAFVDLEGRRFEDAVEPVDLVFDTIGGDLLERSASRIKPGGALVSGAVPPPVEPPDGRAVYFIVEPDRGQLAELAERAGDGRLRAHVGAVYPLAETRAAFEAKHTGVPGKVVIEV